VKPKLIFQRTARRISDAEAEAILGFAIDRTGRCWLREGKVYVKPGALHWFCDVPPRTLVSWEDDEEITRLARPHYRQHALNAGALLRRRA
jgi:hypothetical protein